MSVSRRLSHCALTAQLTDTDHSLPSKAALPEGNPAEGVASNGRSKADLALSESEKIAERMKNKRGGIERKRKAKVPTEAQVHAKLGYTNGFMA